MLVQQAEESFQQGLERLNDGQGIEALAYFNAALEIERRVGQDRPQARYLSYYSLCLSLTHGPIDEAVRCARMAVQMENYRPELWYNLGQVLLAAHKRSRAHHAFCSGLRMQPNHAQLRHAVESMGIRRKPVLPFLPRSSPINIFLGRLIHSPVHTTGRRVMVGYPRG